MSSEGFFRRWSRLKSTDKPAAPPAAPPADLTPTAENEPHPPVTFRQSAGSPARPLPTLEDVDLLGPDSDFSAFVTQGVDKAVQRLAMKKLFSDPHFRVTDGLDVYIDDYTRPDPVSAAMLASLQHAKSALSRALGEDALDDARRGTGRLPPGEPAGDAAPGQAAGQAGREAPPVEAPGPPPPACASPQGSAPGQPPSDCAPPQVNAPGQPPRPAEQPPVRAPGQPPHPDGTWRGAAGDNDNQPGGDPPLPQGDA